MDLMENSRDGEMSMLTSNLNQSATREECKFCGSKDMDIILDFGKQPLANGLLKKAEIGKENKYPLTLCFCKKCGLAQLNYAVDPEELFTNYYWVTGTSESAKNYAKQFKDDAIKCKPISDNGYVLEIASNDGTFLRSFKDDGYEVLGVDPAQNIAEMANKNGIHTIASFFDSSLAKSIIEENGYPDIFFARNVMAHVADLEDFTKGLSICCDDKNVGIVEVHYAGKIINEVHYDSIYHEHLYYYTLHSLKGVLESHGMHVFDVKYSPISGGAIVVYFSKHMYTVSKAVDELLEKEKEQGINKIDSWLGFAAMAKKHKDLMLQMISASHGKIVGYGASARSSTMLNYCGIDCNNLEYIIDLNQLKQGLYTAGTHIPIISAEKAFESFPPDVIVILAWNFKDEIVNYLTTQFNYNKEIIVPLPYPGRKENINAEKN